MRSSKEDKVELQPTHSNEQQNLVRDPQQKA